MKKLWIISVIVSLSIALTACSDDDSSGHGGDVKLVPTGKPKGKFEKTSDAAVAASPTGNCPADGSPRLDPLLKVNQSITQVRAEMNVDGTYGGQFYGPVQKITVLGFGSDWIRRKYEVTRRGVPGSYEEDCSFNTLTSEAVAGTDCKLEKVSRSLLTPGNEHEFGINTGWCHITTYDVDPETGYKALKFEDFEGVYTFPSGRKVKAVFKKTTGQGELSCWNDRIRDFQVIGHGSSYQERIVSSEVPNIDAPASCFQTDIFHYSKDTLDDGTLKQHEQTETTEANF